MMKWLQRAGRVLRSGLPGLALSLVNLLGAFVALAALGGLGGWRGWQFIGFFAVIELATGIAFIIGPNIWHLPVAQGALDVEVQLTASTILLPHWAAVAKGLAGLLLLVAALHQVGVGPATLAVPVFVVAVVALVIGVSLMVARLGVARPDLDVVTLVIRRPRRPERALPGISLSASVVEMIVNLGAFPLVKVLPPRSFYQPELGPSAGTLAAAAGAAGCALLAGFAAWRGRMRWRASRVQQRDAERVAQ